jgi:hypothetical protein
MSSRQVATTALTQYAAICSVAHRGQEAQREVRAAAAAAAAVAAVAAAAAAAAAAAGAGLTVTPQLAREASSSVCRGRFLAVLQASDQKVEDIVLAKREAEGYDSMSGAAALLFAREGKGAGDSTETLRGGGGEEEEEDVGGKGS